jgi:hypothetical protein
MDSLGNGSFVLQLHSKPYVPFIRWLAEADVHVIFLWRNIADALVSLDEHIRFEDHRIPACYIHNRTTYSALSSEERYAFLIQHAVSWYIQLHLMWKQAQALRPLVTGHYEHLLSCPSQFFERLVSRLATTVDRNRLTALNAQKLENIRFNQGLSGRSVTLFSERNKWYLEHLLREYPEDLSSLVNELPWRGNHWSPDVFVYDEAGTFTDILIPDELACAPIGVLGANSIVKQTFCCRWNGLTTIELLCATYGRCMRSGVLKARLEDSGRPVRQLEVPLASVKDNSWLQLTFPSIRDSSGHEFELILTIDGIAEESSFTIRTSDVNPHRGRLHFRGELREGALCMRTLCSSH